MTDNRSLRNPLRAIKTLIRKDSKHGVESEGDPRRDSASSFISYLARTANDAHRPSFGSLEIIDGSKNVSDDESDKEEDDAESHMRNFEINYEDLYSEVLFSTLHTVGCDGSKHQEAILNLLPWVFGISEERHKKLLNEAKTRKPPEIKLDVKVIRAKDLITNDSSAVYFTIHLLSKPNRVHQTSAKPQEEDLTWGKSFEFLIDNAVNETLVLEARHLIYKGLDEDNPQSQQGRFIGEASMLIGDIPQNGSTEWLPLSKEGNLKGQVQVKFALSAITNVREAMNDHRGLLRALLQHEQKESDAPPHMWKGNFSEVAEIILRQHRAQSGLDEDRVQLARWAEYCAHHARYPVDYELLRDTLDKLLPPAANGVFDIEEINLLFCTAKQLINSCLESISKIRFLVPNESGRLAQLSAILTLLSKLSMAEAPFDLFPCPMFKWLSAPGDPNCDVLQCVADAATKGANEWSDLVIASHEEFTVEERESLVNFYNCVLCSLESDLRASLHYYEPVFEQIHFEYVKTLYKVYDDKIFNLLRALLEDTETLDKTKPDLQKEQYAHVRNSLSFYLNLQRFVTFGIENFPKEAYQCSQFNTFFLQGEIRWLREEKYRALEAMENAVDEEDLTPVGDDSKISTSCLDALASIYQIINSWDKIRLCTAEYSYLAPAQLAKIVQDCLLFYVNQLNQKLKRFDIESTLFAVTLQWCTAINNIEYVGKEAEPLFKSLNIDSIIRKMEEHDSEDTVGSRETLQNIVINTKEAMQDKVKELLEQMTQKMGPETSTYLFKAVGNEDSALYSLNCLILYTKKNLQAMAKHMSDENYSLAMVLIWKMLVHQLSGIVEAAVRDKKDIDAFDNILRIMISVEEFFIICGIANRESFDKFAVMKERVRLNSLESSNLINTYHFLRYEEQHLLDETSNKLFGTLAVCCATSDNTLVGEIISGKNINENNPGGMSKTYVVVHLLMEYKFVKITESKVYKRDYFPAYEHKFKMALPLDTRHGRDLLHFVVKESRIMGQDVMIGEAFLPLSKLANGLNLEVVPQFLLPLTKPRDTLESDVFLVLKSRQHKRTVKRFVAREYERMAQGPATPTTNL